MALGMGSWWRFLSRGVLHIMTYMGRLCAKGVPFLGFKYNQRLLGASSWMNWIQNEHGAKCHCSRISWLSFVIIDNRMLKIITSVFIVIRRLGKHSMLKFICLNWFGAVTYSLFSLVFLYFMTFPLCWLLDRLCVHFLAFDFWHVFFGIRYLAFGFWHLLSGIQCFNRRFVSISLVSSVTFWHLCSTNGFKELDPCPKLYVFWP